VNDFPHDEVKKFFGSASGRIEVNSPVADWMWRAFFRYQFDR